MKELCNNINNAANGIIQLDEKYQKLLNTIKYEMRKILEHTEDLPGVKRLSKNVVLVNSSFLSSDSWDPLYYNTGEQVNIIIDKIENTNSYNSLKKCIDNLVESKYVSIRLHKVRLNNNVLNALENIRNNLI